VPNKKRLRLDSTIFFDAYFRLWANIIWWVKLK